MNSPEASRPSNLKMTGQLIGYVLLFVIPAVILGLIFPRYAIGIGFTALFLLLAVSSFLVGRQWMLEDMTEEARRFWREFPVTVLAAMVVVSIIKAIRGEIWALIVIPVGIGVIMLFIILPFFLGRAVG